MSQFYFTNRFGNKKEITQRISTFLQPFLLIQVFFLFLFSTANAQLQVLTPSNSGISLVSNSTYSVTWARGGTTFNRVKIKLSVDGGATYPYLLVNNTPSTATDSSQNVVIPGIITSQAKIRVTNQNDSLVGDASDNDFAITGYCFPWNTVCTNNYIRNFRLNTINTTSTCAARGYINNSASGVRTTSLYRGPNYPFIIKTSKINSDYGVGIWCDFNEDFDFDDEGEFLYGSSSLDTTFSGTISVPNSVTMGSKRLRIRSVRGTLLSASNSCTWFPNTAGEIEDYTVRIGAILSGGPLIVRYPTDAGISLTSTGTATATALWSKGGTTYDRVQIKLSTDGGESFPYLLVNNTNSIPTDTSENFVIPGLITNQARIRITNQLDSTDGDISENDFAITGYCWPWNTVCTGNFIRNVKINTLDNTTNTCSARGYINHGASGANTTLLYRGPSYPFTIKTSKTNNMGLGIWCDFNGDLDFNDAGEFIYGSSSLDTTFTGSIVIPNEVSAGAKRLRIRTVVGQLLGASDACTYFPNVNGEIEDFTVTIGAILASGPLTVQYPSDAGISLASTGTATATARWSKGGSTYDRVQIKLSTDGGATYPYLLVNNTNNIPTDTSENFVIPGLITNQARIRIANQNDSTQGDISDNDFAITGYCWPWNTVCTGNFIRNVKINTLDNTTNTCSARGYINNGASGANTTFLYRGPSYPFTVKTSKTNNMGLGIWCDFNGDLDFNDAGEFIYGSSSLDTTFSGSIVIPNEVSAGTKRLRIRTVVGQLLGASDACTYFPNVNGEIEDFTVTIGAILASGPLTVRYPSDAGISLATTGTATATALWSKGGSTYDRVQIKLSTDGGATYPYLLVNNTNNIPTDTSENFVIPGLITNQARIRIANQNDSTQGDISDNDFAITGYCWPWNTVCTGNFIRNVKINTLDNTTNTCSARGYINHGASGANTTLLYRGPSYPFTIKTSKTNNMGLGIWCDFNGDLDFNDAGEFIYGSSSLDTTFSGSIVIPNEVSADTKRLRIRTVVGQLLGASDACTYFPNVNGEIEDFTVTIGAILASGPLTVLNPSDAGISLATTGTATATARWSKGGSIYDRVQIKLSTDGGATYPYLLVNNTPNTAADTSENFVIPGLITNQARIRIANQNDSTQGDISDNDFAITGYCWPWNTVCTDNYLSAFQINTLVNTNNTCSSRGYTNIPASGANTTTLYRGPSYNYTIKTSKINTNMGVGMWCDFNGDLDFNDAGEFIFGSSTLDTSFTGSIVIPNEVSAGTKRLRIRTVHGQLLGASDACTYFPNVNGEIEDFTITVGGILSDGPLVVRNPSDSGISLTSTGTGTSIARWSKGGTTFDRVQIKLSTDGGVTFPYLLVNNTPSIPTDTSEAFVIPGLITNQARIRIANQNDSTQGDISDNDFAITGYCWPWNTVCTGGFISNVTINATLNNTSACSPRGYVVNSATPGNTTTMQRGLGYPFSVTTSTSMALAIWCDFNEDTDFDDPGEFLYASPSFGTSFSGTLQIPEAIPTGTKRLRVRAVSGRLLTANDYCTYIPGGGEMEGYNITINQPTIVVSAPVGTQCAGSNINVAFNTTGTFLPGNSFQVQLSGPGGVFGSGVSVIGTGPSSPIPCYIHLGTVPGTYRIRVVSSTPAPSNFGTNSGTFTIRAKPSELVATSAERCGPGTLTLTTSGCTTTRWYDAPDEGTQVGTGNSFTTPVLTESKTYYVTCVSAQGCQGNRTPVYATIKPVPVVTDITPTSGVVDLDIITITGTGFASLDSIHFSPGKKGYIASYNATTITAKAPVGTTAGPITVYTKCGNTTSGQSFTPVVPFIADPIISLASGTYPLATSTTLSCATVGADIYYTLDGSNPVVGSANTRKYAGGSLFIGASLTLKAIGFRTGWTTSGIASATYTITTPTRAATPVITPPTGTYVGGQYVTITCSTPGSTIYYTTNGQTPQPGVNNPVKYLGPFTRIDAIVPIKALAIADGYFNSLIASSTLTISGASSLSACSFSPLPGTYGGPQVVTITNPDPAAQIYYTLDGTDPYIYSPLAIPYTGPVSINNSRTLKAQAFRPGFGDGPRTTGIYTIGAFRQNSVSNPNQPVYYTEDAETSQNKVAQSEWLNQLNHSDRTHVRVYPNPTSGIIWVELGKEVESPRMSLVNMLGQEVENRLLEGSQSGFEVNLSSLPSGFYIIRISDSNGFIDEKRVARY